MHKYKIIVVEDDEITALNLNLSLKKQGYDVVAICDNEAQAKQKISALMPNLILIDISLQENNDGIELAKVVKQEYNLPFIYLTSHSDDEIISQAKHTEPYGYIVKPFDPAALHATIQMALFKYEMENERQEDIATLKVDKVNLEKLLYSKRESDKPIVPFGDEYYLDINIHETFF